MVYEEDIIDVSNMTIGSEYDFKLVSRAPKNPHDFFSVSAVLNVGWCRKPEADEWLRYHDYLTDTSYTLKEMRKKLPEYEITMALKYYGMYAFVVYDEWI